MIDERQEELAALHALDLLEGAERAQFEATLARDPELQQLVRQLRESAMAIAHLPKADAPPAALKTRLLASIDQAPASAAADNVVRPPASLFSAFAPWAVAACLAVTATWLGRLYVNVRAENTLLFQKEALAEIAVQSTQQQLDAERIITRRRLEDLGQQLTNVSRERDSSVTQLADARTRLAEREGQLASQTQQLDMLRTNSRELSGQLGEAKEQVAKLTAEMKTQGDIAHLKITTLASMLDNSPQALAVAVWDPTKQGGLLKVQKLPALATDQDYQLWVVDAADPTTPVDGGVFTVDPVTGEASISFRPKRAVSAVAAFAITRERKGGVIKSAGPILLLGK